MVSYFALLGHCDSLYPIATAVKCDVARVYLVDELLVAEFKRLRLGALRYVKEVRLPA